MLFPQPRLVLTNEKKRGGEKKKNFFKIKGNKL